jgi:hypothetical protein
MITRQKLEEIEERSKRATPYINDMYLAQKWHRYTTDFLGNSCADILALVDLIREAVAIIEHGTEKKEREEFLRKWRG